MPGVERSLKRTYRIAAKVVASGIIGILLFILISIFLIAFIPTNDDPRGAMEGWPVGFLIIASAICSIFLSGAIVMMVSYTDISSRLEIILIPVFSGLITSIIPLLIAMLLGLRSIGLIYIGIIVLLVCLAISVLGGLLAYIVLSLIRKIRQKSI
jgi:hypothetical protein